ncbi:fimbria/pilus outer membrane usher protein [Aeromonas veronii]|uniref:fimbria/pilus outer membrane usher protein n=1 Tax=Aeromonas veronii TaxID=654 RepID=UPI001F3B63BE|nr:fimbria/pilus outer membrane usher protein [Aeromonas veronii]
MDMKYQRLLLLGLLAMVLPLLGRADYRFDPALLGGDVDMTTLLEGQPAGIYQVEVLINGRVVDSRELAFERGEDGSLQTCLSKAQILSYGIWVDEYPALAGQTGGKEGAPTTSEQCVDISAIPDASATFDFYSQQLRLSVPQVALLQEELGIAPQVLWDDGIAALLMNYSVSVNRDSSHSSFGSYRNEQWSATLEPGLNLGAWRVRNASSWQPGEWQYTYTFAERGLNDWQSRLTLGERFSSSAVLDGVPLTGVILATDEEMVPYEQRVYGPVVRGVARSQARVEVRQNGYLVFSTTVAPGPFEFNDLASGGAGGDLEVTVLESDGPPQVFTVTYATPAIALREGVFKYDLAVGHYRSASQGVEETPLGQFSLMYGLPFDLTAFGGGQWSSHYRAGTLGAGASLGMLGALSVDSSRGHWQRQGHDAEGGHKWRLLYSKFVEPTQSWFSLESNQYAANGFRNMADVLDSYDESNGSGAFNRQTRGLAKMATSFTLGQSLGGGGNLNIAVIQTRYRDDRPSDTSLRLSYGGSYKGASFSLDWSNSYQGEWGGQAARRDRQVGMRLSYPLSLGQSQPVYVSYQLRDGNNRAQQHEIGVRGSAFERRMNWDVREQRSSGSGQRGQDRSLLNLGWSGKYGIFNGGYGYGGNSQQMNANVAGGIVLHRDGLTLGQPLGQTVGLVAAPDAADMAVGSWPGVRTDPRGYTTLGSLTPYQVNEVSIDPLSLPEDVSLSQTEIKVVPTSGAVVPVPFATRKGANGMIQLSRPDGTLIPFGAVVMEEGKTRTGMSVGIVGYEGDVYLSGLQDSGQLLVRWGSADDQQCLVDYHLPASPSEFGGLYELRAICQ